VLALRRIEDIFAVDGGSEHLEPAVVDHEMKS